MRRGHAGVGAAAQGPPRAGRAHEGRAPREGSRGLAIAPRLGYGRPEMPQRETDRRRDSTGAEASRSAPRRSVNPVLELQRSIGNRATAQVLARTPTGTGTVEIGAVGKIKVKGGNLAEWAGKGAPDTVDVTSQTGKHSAKLDKLASERTRTDVKVMIAPAGAEGENLNVGGGTQLVIAGARIKGYAVADGVETWRIDDFTNVSRTKITHTIGAG